MSQQLTSSKLKKPKNRCIFAVKIFISLISIVLCLTQSAYSMDMQLAWDEPTNHEVVDGYEIHWGKSSGNYTSNQDCGKVNTCTVTISDFQSQQSYYTAAISYDNSGNTSEYSNELIVHSITTSTVPGGLIAPSGDILVENGKNQTFNITSAAGYVIEDILVDGTSVGAVSTYTFSNVNTHHTITATFKLINNTSHTLTATAGPGGTISPSGAIDVEHGSSQALTITPDNGYSIDDVLVDGASVGAVSTYTFSDVDAPHTITATFILTNNSYTITASAGPGGTITPSTATVNYGGSQTFTISADTETGYHISDVLVDGSSVGAVSSYTFHNVTANHTISTSFSQTINDTWLEDFNDLANGTTVDTGLTSWTSTGGSVQNQTYRMGGENAIHTWESEEIDIGGSGSADISIDIAGIPNGGNGMETSDYISIYYQLDGGTWSEFSNSNSQFDWKTESVTGLSGNTLKIKVEAKVSYNDEFYYIDNVLVSSDGGTSTTYTLTASAGNGGTITPSTAIVNQGDNQTFTISAYTGYHISDVLVDGSSIGAVNKYTFTNVTSSHTIEAAFAINTYNITGTAGNGGTISPSGTVLVNHGSSQTFTIDPDAGYEIADVKIDGSSVGPQETYSFTNITASHTIAATFEKLVESVFKIETGTVLAGDIPVIVNLTNTYMSPVVVCTVNYSENVIPVLPRVSQVSSNSFSIHLQNPSGLDVLEETVHYLVVEEGTWELPDGGKIEAHKYLSTVTDRKNSWIGETVSYENSYINPVVLGQVMSENDTNWSAFWNSGSSRTNPPDSSNLKIGKHTGEDPNSTRDDEEIGYIVIEAGLGEINGVKYEAFLGNDSVRGINNSPPYRYRLSNFSITPEVAIATQAAMDGSDGGWAYLYGFTPLTDTSIDLAIDEDQLQDRERSHTTEQIGCIVFESSFAYPESEPEVEQEAFTIWQATEVPATPADPDTAAVELGVKFRSDSDGYITGIRFYKSNENTGRHVGSLWTNNGQLLAQATFTNESDSGWQQVDFETPVAITTNTVYVASYHAPNGRYAADVGYFATAGVDNGPLHALQDGESGGNSVYLYGAGGFPTNTWQSANYWVDVVFQP